MSMTLILWKAPVLDDPDDAKSLLEPWYERDDDSAFAPSEDVATVRERLRASYPDDPSSETHSDESCPWSDLPIEDNDRLLVLHIRWGADPQVLADITAFARIHGLVLYNPQGPDIILPTEPVQQLTEIPSPTLFEWAKAIGIAAVLMGLTWAAWLIPIGWLRWPLVLISGFLAAAGLFVVFAMIFGRRILERDRRR